MPQLLRRQAAGDVDADGRVWSAIYSDLHRLARMAVARERPSPDLQASGVACEAYLRIFKTGMPVWRGRRYYIATLARAIEQYLLDRARTRNRVKRGGGIRPLSLSVLPGELASFDRASACDAAPLFDALRELEQVAPRAAEVTRVLYVLNLSTEATAELLGVSTATVKREWGLARAFMLRALKRAGEADNESNAPSSFITAPRVSRQCGPEAGGCCE